MRKNCNEIYRQVLQFEKSDSSLFDLAQCFLDGYDPNRLHLMLISEDQGIVSDGLFVLGEIGALARNYASDIRALTHSSDPDIRRGATRLAALYVDR